MKKLFYFTVAVALLWSCEKDEPVEETTTPEPVIITENLSMNAAYSNDIYYSLADGEVSSPDREEWDIAFYTNPMTSTIRINDGAGIELYVWPDGDKSNWDVAIDTAGMMWPEAQYNNYSDTTWENGAFDQNSLGHPDYGWGTYDMDSHTVTGDSIHILKLGDGSLKKLYIAERAAMTNTFVIKYANLDGTDEQSKEVACNDHLDKNMIHFSVTNNTVVTHEPLAESWDLVFTKYTDMIYMGPTPVPYPVTGLLANNDIMIAEGDTTTTDYMNLEYSKVISTIGSDWKSFNMETFQYDLNENMVFFIKDLNGKYYSLRFTAFEGSSSGNISFILTKF